MPVRSSVVALPPEVKEWLDKSLIEGNFSGYEALAEALKDKGFNISKSSIHRYGKDFEDNLAAMKLVTEQAKVVIGACPDDEGTVDEALIRLTQQKAFQMLHKVNIDKEKIKFSDLGKIVSLLTKASTGVKKYAAEVRGKIETRLKSLESDSQTGKNNLDVETLRRVREEIYGIVS